MADFFVLTFLIFLSASFNFFFLLRLTIRFLVDLRMFFRTLIDLFMEQLYTESPPCQAASMHVEEYSETQRQSERIKPVPDQLMRSLYI
jgi:hypothetical protein